MKLTKRNTKMKNPSPFGEILLVCVFVLLFVFPQSVLAERNDSDFLIKSYTGVVLGEDKRPLPYATVSVINTPFSTVSNSEGEFLLKVSEKFSKNLLVVSFLGYEDYTIPLSNLKEYGNVLVMTPGRFELPVLEVLTKDPDYIFRKMLDNFDNNYSKKDAMMTSFYRETIRKRNTNISLSEAIVEVYKRGVGSSFLDMASLYKSRKSTDYNRLDTIAFKLMGGPFNNIYLDVTRYPEVIFGDNTESYYEFKLLRVDVLAGHTVYVVSFEQFPHIENSLYNGKLYIDVESYALMRAEFSLNLKNNKEATRIFVRKKPLNARVSTVRADYLVDYRKMGGLWYYAYSRIDLGLKIHWKRKLFNTIYNSSIEMAATDWDEEMTRQEFRKKERISPAVIIRDEASGFSDVEFWGEHNIIEPDKSIENAIHKIIKQLEKEKRKHE